MTVLKNRTQKNFTMISNNILRDTELKMIDRGMLCTLCSLPDGWNFSVAGLTAIVPDGKSAITNSLKRLENIGYLKRTTYHGKRGKFETEIEVFAEKIENLPLPIYRDRKTVTDNPSQENRNGEAVTENQPQYNINNNRQTIKTDNTKSVNQSAEISMVDREIESKDYKNLIADNIKLNRLLEVAKRNGEREVAIVNEVYDLVCDMVCYPRDYVVIKNTKYPWRTVKIQFLKLRYQHIRDILNRIVDADLRVKNMSAYLVSTLFTASLVGSIEFEARLHDDYLKYLRGNPY
ncbi:DUF6017 domain-containing protein [Mediterraneibacter gnavus]|uniref:DUF6017 domain-containing protein n=1 Tax=Mediterraneibacter gnavus TaxID=33038 RepID=UPI00232AF53A|nr:DUF6017 domain-containing protein [Mediterraneibacter gnavus]MDB8709735.1 DUF6017 domain-containing protein [Mediterraneibacter gnavus]MDB8712501.1 DUF6017 domain-containing protein [Mediterraneibacter gnavus]